MNALSLARFAPVAILLASSACGPRISPVDYKTPAAAQTKDYANWTLASVSVQIPEEMKVNTDGSIRYPDPDHLVWWGDPPGDRKAQVIALMSDAVTAGALDAMTGAKPVELRLKIDQFHAMTPKARATNLQLGVHEIRFDLQVVDAQTGAVLAAENDISADFRAFSGSQAVLAEQAGQGQKIRIQTRVAQVIRSWLHDTL